jgi:hypothetical protein
VAAPRLKWEKMRSHPKPKAGTGNASLVLSYVDPQNPSKARRGDAIELWVNNVAADFSMTGTTAQSIAKRDFYPRNFNQPAYSISGQTFSERHYGQLGEFVRWAQKECIFNNGIMEFVAPAAGPDEVWVPTGRGKRKVKRPIVRGQRGRRPTLWIQGYVGTMPRKHAVGVQSPEYTFAFIVSRVLVGPLKDQAVSPAVLPKNWDSFIKRDATGFILNPDDVLLTQQRKAKGTPVTRAPDVAHGTTEVDAKYGRD